ncbi:MAG: polysaccharide biosynthesis/export family protein [Dysgonamonadaceae bacterium]|jgi:polysaccharide export outer membrane protein|nr:polysaccharide biosynthesis/export family protein [Dysgonamonadaceae bacterium]
MRLFHGLFILALLGTTSCAYRKIIFMQDKNHPKEAEYPTMLEENIVRFQPDDIITIAVNIPGHPEIAADFNLPLVPTASTYDLGSTLNQSVGRQSYRIDRNGDIPFPIIGKMKVSGYTPKELETKIAEMIKSDYIKDGSEPVVTVQLTNFTIYFLGREGGGGSITVNKDHITIFEALSLHGGGESYSGKQDFVLLIRPLPDGTQKHVRIDLTKIDIVSSPYYYLHQNDMIYIEPRKFKLIQTEFQNVGVITSALSLLVTGIGFYFYFRSLNNK